MAAFFTIACPLWLAGREREMNLLAGFRASFLLPADGDAYLSIAACTAYRIWLDGAFLADGPARAPHGFFRVDRLMLPHLAAGPHLVAIQAVAANVNAYAVLDQTGFLQAEVTSAGAVLAATMTASAPAGVAAFTGRCLTHRIQAVPKFTHQRSFIEAYRQDPAVDDWIHDPAAVFVGEPLARQPGGTLIDRHSPRPDFTLRQPVRWLLAHALREDRQAAITRNPRLFAPPDVPLVKGFTAAAVQADPWMEVQRFLVSDTRVVDTPFLPGSPASWTGPGSQVVDFGRELTGTIGLTVSCGAPLRLRLIGDEVLVDGRVSRTRQCSAGFAAWDLTPGRHHLMTLEPYALRYLEIVSLDAPLTVEDVVLREIAHPHARRARFSCSDPRLNRIFDAAVETFRQNSVDLFMDCPGRERAGWLCDSFFTARVEPDLTGDNGVEHDFLENFALPGDFAPLPAGMLPRVWPADLFDGKIFIPNWALFFVLQLEEYLDRTGDRDLVDRLRGRTLALFDYFQRFVNQDGLVERLESWVFVEWSKANDLVQDVSHPSNMLLAAALAAAARLYRRPDLAARAEAVHAALRRTAFANGWFVDNAVRRDGTLVLSGESTEVCQYYAFFCGTATQSSHPDLWRRVLDELGPSRRRTGAHPRIHPANAFIGNYLRLELLSRAGRRSQIARELVDLFLTMADTTGTLWEHDRPQASCNHGFASHAAHVLIREIAGLVRIDRPRRTVTVDLDLELPLDWCEVELPCGVDRLRLRWWKQDGALHHDLDLPAGWRAITPQSR